MRREDERGTRQTWGTLSLFFSSRRRHTSWPRDWSSDVCSSDLPDAVQPFLDYILPRMRADQTFLVTEFSLVWHWKAHLRNAIDPDFALKYELDPDRKSVV